MSVLRYRAQAACLLAGVVLGGGGASVLGSNGGSHGVADEGCVHITTSATVCDSDAKRVCNSTAAFLAGYRVYRGSAKVTPTQALMAEECPKV